MKPVIYGLVCCFGWIFWATGLGGLFAQDNCDLVDLPLIVSDESLAKVNPNDIESFTPIDSAYYLRAGVGVDIAHMAFIDAPVAESAGLDDIVSVDPYARIYKAGAIADVESVAIQSAPIIRGESKTEAKFYILPGLFIPSIIGPTL